MTTEDCDTDFEGDDHDGDFDPLFGEIVPGPQVDGTLIEDLGWAGMGLLETLGIESLVGVRGFNSADGYYRRMQVASGSSLPDWHGVHLRLYECWYLEPMEGSYCYATWRATADSNALCSRPVDAYCLRHVAWAADAHRRAVNCARTRSYCIAAHIKAKPDVPVSPQVMLDVSGEGLKLTGIRSGEQEETVLDWPTPDMEKVLTLAATCRAAGVRDIHLWEHGIGFCLDALDDGDFKRLLNVDRYYGGEMSLSDLAREAGIS